MFQRWFVWGGIIDLYSYKIFSLDGWTLLMQLFALSQINKFKQILACCSFISMHVSPWKAISACRLANLHHVTYISLSCRLWWTSRHNRPSSETYERFTTLKVVIFVKGYSLKYLSVVIEPKILAVLMLCTDFWIKSDSLAGASGKTFLSQWALALYGTRDFTRWMCLAQKQYLRLSFKCLKDLHWRR